MEAHGYRITGDHYFFLNYYQLPESQVEKKEGLNNNQVDEDEEAWDHIDSDWDENNQVE
jgi:hypothetical protein